MVSPLESPKLLLAGLVIGLIIMGIPLYMTKTQLDQTQNEKQQLQEQLNQANKEITTLQNQINQLTSEKNNLENQVNNLEEQLSTLQSKYNKLTEDYNSLKTNYTNLQQSYNTLQNNYTNLKSQYSLLQYQYNQLNSDYIDLVNLHNQVLDTITNLSHWYGYSTSNEDLKQFYTYLLNESVRQITSIISLSRYSNEGPASKALDVFTDVLLSLSYCNDTTIRLLDPNDPTRIITNDQIYNLPNETWTTGCGDCEDLALFTYAMLKATSGATDKVYIIGWYAGDTGHWAVFYSSTYQGTREYHIIDPAGNYVNGLTLYLSLKLSSPYTTIYLDPLRIDWTEKNYILQYGDLAYYDVFEDQFYNYDNAPRYYYTDIQYALEEWITQYWQPQLNQPIDTIIIIGPNIYQEFTSIVEAANWLALNT